MLLVLLLLNTALATADGTERTSTAAWDPFQATHDACAVLRRRMETGRMAAALEAHQAVKVAGSAKLMGGSDLVSTRAEK